MSDGQVESSPSNLMSEAARVAYDRALANDGVVWADTHADIISELELLGLAQRDEDQWVAQPPTGPLGVVLSDLQQRTSATAPSPATSRSRGRSTWCARPPSGAPVTRRSPSSTSC